MKNTLVLLLGLVLVACGGDSDSLEEAAWSSDEKENFEILCNAREQGQSSSEELCECLLDEIMSKVSYAEWHRYLMFPDYRFLESTPEMEKMEKESREFAYELRDLPNECYKKIEEDQDNRRDRGRMSYSSRRASYAKHAELQIKNMVKSASTYILEGGEVPPDCWETMKERGYIEIKQAVTENWDFQCSWQLDETDGIIGTITATSTEENDAGPGKTIEYQIETEEFTGYGQGNAE